MSPAPNIDSVKWYHRWWFVLLMLLVVLGPLALPLLWKSPQFPRLVKIILTILMVLEILWLIVLGFTAVEATRRYFQQFQLALPSF